MERRSFLVGTGTLLLSQLLVSCGGNNQAQLQVRLLQDSIPGQVVDRFKKSLQQNPQLTFSPVKHLEDLFQQLQTWQKKVDPTEEGGWRRFIPLAKSQKANPADLVTVEDYWISAAIRQKLIQPLEVQQLKNWSTLPKKWQELVTRDDQGLVNAKGKVWGAPYRWGSTVIVYNRDQFVEELGWIPKDWTDLWRGEVQSRISLLDHPREVIGLVLKKLGKSYNTENLDTVPDLEKELRALNQQVKFYSSTRYLEPLLTGDTWLAVGWSDDVLPVLTHYPQLAVAIPQSGTAIWADLWVQPKGKEVKNLSYQWIDFCWTGDIAKDISVLTKTNAPTSTKINPSDMPQPLPELLQTNTEVFDKSEFLLPLPEKATNQYESLFAKIKQIGDG